MFCGAYMVVYDMIHFYFSLVIPVLRIVSFFVLVLPQGVCQALSVGCSLRFSVVSALVLCGAVWYRVPVCGPPKDMMERGCTCWYGVGEGGRSVIPPVTVVPRCVSQQF